MNKGVFFVIFGAVLIILGGIVGLGSMFVPAFQMENAYSSDFKYNGTAYTYTFEDIGPGTLNVNARYDYETEVSIRVTGAKQGLIKEETGYDLSISMDLEKEDDYTVAITGVSSTYGYYSATYTGENLLYICLGTCGGSILLFLIGTILIIVGIVVWVKSMPKKKKKPTPPAYMYGQPPPGQYYYGKPHQPETMGASAEENPYAGQPYYPYPPPQGGQYPYPPQGAPYPDGQEQPKKKKGKKKKPKE